MIISLNKKNLLFKLKEGFLMAYLFLIASMIFIYETPLNGKNEAIKTMANVSPIITCLDNTSKNESHKKRF